LPRCKLGHITEQRVLKVGLMEMLKIFMSTSEASIEQLPGNPEILRKMLGKATLSRLLSGQVEFKSCMENDVASAQSDLRYLTAEQLLHLRVPTLDFATEANSHSARLSFLESVDKNMFNKIPQRMGCDPALAIRPELLHALGFRIVLAIGAADLLKSGWGTSPQKDGAIAPVMALPSDWVFKLQPEQWVNESCVAHVNVESCRLNLIAGEWPDLSGIVPDQVAVICDRTKGVGKDRMFHWEITVVNPRQHNVLHGMDDSAESKQQHLTDELSEALSRRRNGPATPLQKEAISEKTTSRDTNITEELELALSRRRSPVVEVERTPSREQNVSEELRLALSRRRLDSEDPIPE